MIYWYVGLCMSFLLLLGNFRFRNVQLFLFVPFRFRHRLLDIFHKKWGCHPPPPNMCSWALRPWKRWWFRHLISLKSSEHDSQNSANKSLINWLLNMKCPTFKIEFRSCLKLTVDFWTIFLTCFKSRMLF